MKKKKIFAIIMSLIVLSLTFFTCCVPKKPNVVVDEPQYRFDKIENGWGEITGRTLTIWGKGTEINRIYMQNAFARYEALTGNKIVTREIGNDNYNDTLSAALKQGSTDSFDVLMTYGGKNLAPLDPDNNLFDLSNELWVSDVTLQALSQTIYQGKVIGLPHSEASISGTLFNKEIFKKYNIKIPKNCDEFLDVCDKLASNGIVPMYLPFKDINMLLYQFGMDSIVQAPDVLNGLNKMTLKYSDIPEMKTLIEWYVKMADRGYFGKNFLDNDWDGINSALSSGKYAMMLGWDTFLYTNYSGNPSVFGLMPAFVGVPFCGSYEGPNLSLLTVNKNGENVDLAIDLLRFMSDPFNYNKAFEGISTSSVFKNQKGSISTPQYIENEKEITKLYFDSTAWLRVDGFSQADAKFIVKAMTDKSYSVLDCLNDMDTARINRILMG